MIRACPFCGAEAKVCRSRKKNDLQVYVRCNSCGAQTKRRRAKEIRDADDFMNQPAVEDIVRLWNSGIAKRPQRDSYEHRSFDFLTHDSILNTCSERCIRSLQNNEKKGGISDGKETALQERHQPQALRGVWRFG